MLRALSGRGNDRIRLSSPSPHGAEAKRKPRLLLRFDGAILLRFADRQFLAMLFPLPPRITRFERCSTFFWPI